MYGLSDRSSLLFVTGLMCIILRCCCCCNKCISGDWRFRQSLLSTPKIEERDRVRHKQRFRGSISYGDYERSDALVLAQTDVAIILRCARKRCANIGQTIISWCGHHLAMVSRMGPLT
jgi:hypothetical protein